MQIDCDLVLYTNQETRAGCLAAVASVHSHGIVHEGLGVAAFMLSSVSDGDAARLGVKIDNLGVGRRISGGAGPDGALEEGQRRDMEALAAAFAEFAFGAARPWAACCGTPASRGPGAAGTGGMVPLFVSQRNRARTAADTQRTFARRWRLVSMRLFLGRACMCAISGRCGATAWIVAVRGTSGGEGPWRGMHVLVDVPQEQRVIATIGATRRTAA